MPKKILILSLSFILISSTIALANLKTISTIGYSQIEKTPDSGMIKAEIVGLGAGKANLEHKLRQRLNNLKDELTKKKEVNKDKITKSEIESNNIEANDYKATIILTIEFNEQEKDLATVSSNLIEIIDQAHPQRRATYNQNYEFDYEIIQAYYTFEQVEKYQQQLFETALEVSQQKAESLAKINNFSSIEMIKIKEQEKTKDLMNYQEKIELNQPQKPTAQSFSERLRVDYQFN
ncbi:SIMPL domain-containing protein [Natroniella sulfidigena]|uniref:SIMPL domain-containing protein n=1 Tax=Natroniella sulfidigena TaxID=723921 RepID=UPI00200A1323|nr:SIMPL domain-containing protein [Natroniella sulfidigena]MCK8817553.1 SIMPL domain-containing protein [Natroniella sulfidigena]